MSQYKHDGNKVRRHKGFSFRLSSGVG